MTRLEVILETVSNILNEYTKEELARRKRSSQHALGTLIAVEREADRGLHPTDRNVEKAMRAAWNKAPEGSAVKAYVERKQAVDPQDNVLGRLWIADRRNRVVRRLTSK